MSCVGLHIFPTSLGHCAVGWSARGLVAFELPAADEQCALAAIGPKLPYAAVSMPPPTFISAIAERVMRHLLGQPASYADVTLDLDKFSPFSRDIYEALRTVEPGEVITYGELARLAGHPRAIRAAGGSLGRNPLPLIIPCHRVVAANGQLGGFSAAGGVHLKEKLLTLEGAVIYQSANQ